MAEVDLVLKVGTDAIEWLNAPENVSGCHQLQRSSNWATPYQSPEYCQLWLESYSHTWQPIIVISTSGTSGLSGFLPLAKKGNQIYGLGAAQTEYQGWLCLEEIEQEFPAKALALIFEEFPDAHLRLRYIDAGDNWRKIERSLRAMPNVMLTGHSRPLLSLDTGQASAALRKKSNRSKINRLKRLGDLQFIVDSTEQDIEQELKQAATLYDFRQGAVNGTSPFLEDSQKLPFHLNWLRQNEGPLLFYRLLLDGQVIGALIGVVSRDRVSNAVLAYSASLGKHSPGKLILYMAASDMADRGFRYLDLTPGGDPWKKRFANQHDTVMEINAWRNAKPIGRLQRQETFLEVGRRVLERLGTTPADARKTLHAAGSQLKHPGKLVHRIGRMKPQTVEYRVYSVTPNRFADVLDKHAQTTTPPNENNLSDLLMFDEQQSWATRQNFLSSALARLEQGEQCYTYAENGLLLHYGWKIPRQTTSRFSEVQQSYTYAEAGTVLYDFYTHPSARGLGLYQQNLIYLIGRHAQFCRDESSGSAVGEGSNLYISVLADNGPSRHAIEKVGFQQIDSIIRHKRFDRFVSSQGEAPTITTRG